ncbi:MAG: cell division protein FtsA [Bacteroides sp.]|nr:cell division protein FtsA [Bacteroides sp.]
MEEKYIVALEIGSSKIKGAIGIVDASGALSVKTVEEEKLTESVRYGCIRNILETTNAIRSVITRLEQREPQRKITGVYVSIGGRSLMSKDIEVERRLASPMEITNDLIVDIINEAMNEQLHERTIVDVLPKEFSVDKMSTRSVVGTFGSHINARLNLISCRSMLMRNLNMVLDERLHLNIHNVFVRPIAEANLVLFNEEKRQGCMFVDCGADTTTVAIYKNGVLAYLSTLPMGSRNITRDITALNFTEERAEELKIEGGNAISTPDPMAAPHKGVGVDFNQINNYVAARAGEIISNINEQLKYAGMSAEMLPGGIILVGRGAKLNGFDRRLESVTSMKVRYGAPANRIRILDGRLNGADNVDVISILAMAAKENEVCECMERIMPEYTTPLHQHAPQMQESAYGGGEAAASYNQPSQYPYQQQGQQSQQSYQPQQPQPRQQQAYQPRQQAAAYQQPQQQQYQPQQPTFQQPQQQQAYQPQQQQPQGQQAYQPQQPQQQAQGQQAYQPQQPGGYPYHAGQQAYQAPQTYNNPYSQQARNITAAEPSEEAASETRAPERKKSKLSKFFDGMRERVTILLSEPVDDDDSDN